MLQSHSLMIFVGDEPGKRAFMQIGQLVKAPDERKVSFFQIFLPFTIFVYRKTQLEF